MDLARTWAMIGNKKEAFSILDDMWKTASQYMRWYCNLSGSRFESAQSECNTQFYIMQQLISIGETLDEKWADKRMSELNRMAEFYQSKGGSFAY